MVNNISKRMQVCIAMVMVCFIVISQTVNTFAYETISTSSPKSNEFTVQTLCSNKYEEARSMLSMINDFRRSKDAWYWNQSDSAKINCSNLSNLIYDYDLEKVAVERAKELTVLWSHTRPNGEECFTAYPSGDYGYAGENIAYGQTSAVSVFNAWKEDDKGYSGQGHRRNMLSSDYNAIGIACFEINGRKFWVQEFGKKRGTISSTINSYSSEKKLYETNVSDSIFKIEKEDLNYTKSVSLTVNQSVEVDLGVYFVGNYTPGFKLYLPTTKTVTDPSVISLSDDGTIKGLKTGKTTIKLAAKISGSKTETVEIAVEVKPISIEDAKVTLSGNSFEYTGNEITPGVKVTLDSTALTENIDYTVSYKNNTNAGSAAKVIITGIGNYSGSKEVSFTIKKSSTVNNNTNTIKTNMMVADKKTAGKYKITKIIKKNGKITGGEVEYVAPYNKNCASATVAGKVKIGGVYYKITCVGRDAFKGCKKVTKVVIGSNVTVIGTRAFNGCSKLKTVKFNTNKIKRIGTNAFKDISKTATFKVPKTQLAKYTKMIRKANAPKKVKVTK